MYCANHPDIQAMAACRQCGKPLCALCVYFREGEAWCQEHFAPAEAGADAGETAPSAGQDLVVQPAEGDQSVVSNGAALLPGSSGEPALAPGAAAELPDISGGPVTAPDATNTGVEQPALVRRKTAPLPPVPLPQFAAPQRTPPAWQNDPRLEPLPLELRPGWSDEPLVKPPGSADSLGLAGLVIGLASLPASFCCGFGAPFGLLLGLLGGGLSVFALVNAGQARNPSQARTVAGIGIGFAVLAILAGLCMTALIFGAGGLALLGIQ